MKVSPCVMDTCIRFGLFLLSHACISFLFGCLRGRNETPTCVFKSRQSKDSGFLHMFSELETKHNKRTYMYVYTLGEQSTFNPKKTGGHHAPPPPSLLSS